MSRMNKYGQKRASHKRMIQKALDDAGLNYINIAERAGLSRQTVCATVNGHCHSVKVLEELRKAGVPERFLFDPRRVEQAEYSINHEKQEAV